ncbi:endogenous retrovirus group S71 member 1 Env polyprotein-like [Erinaceus europaeus]|uniref:Endogenous retrovirus group S71 member 1 Env polyprotein-like n=1 Tax=Erinaceus europaeus TaxID=9365 RepID=A0A1S3W391_ERIEU|nr:endogenous retrovirus group S71 member 1 Env polyprotein-like [Erinaceus europaeus]
MNADERVILEYFTSGQPIFVFDLCDLFSSSWSGRNDSSQITNNEGCSTIDREHHLRDRPLSVCAQRPWSQPPRVTGSHGREYIQPQCYTISPARNAAPHIADTYIELQRIHQNDDSNSHRREPHLGGSCTIGDCNPLSIKVKTWYDADLWTKGKTWGMVVDFTGQNPSTFFTIQLEVQPWSQNPIGPLRPILLGQDPRVTSSPPTVAEAGENQSSPEPTGIVGQGANIPPEVPPRVKTLVRSVELMYNLLNDSAPNVTHDCWLCLHPEPPYYIGVAAIAEIGSSKGNIKKLTLSSGNSNGPECRWGTQPHMTLEDIQGRGTCIITINYKLHLSPFQGNCNNTIRVSKTQEWAVLLKAPEGTWWACTSGMAPCISSYGLPKESLCVLVHILPHVYYAHGGAGWGHLERQEGHYLRPRRQKRALVLVPLLAGAAIVGSLAVGATALAKESTIVQLDQAVNKDLMTLEGSIEALEGSLTSLAEMVLQNRRGLDLIFLKQGGLCVALNEACCFYANHSGLIKKTLSEVKARIEDRAQKWKELSEDNWFTGWFSNLFASWPTWVKTLISTIAGPMIALLLIITLGPCLWKTLVSMIQRRIGKTMLLKTYVETGGYIDYDTEEEREGEEESSI